MAAVEPLNYAVRGPIVQAMQWTEDNEAALQAWLGNDTFHAVDPEDRTDDVDATGALRESVHNTWVTLETGDWVIKGMTGHVFARSPEDFEADYAAVES